MKGLMTRNRGKAAVALALLLALAGTVPFALGQGGQPPAPLEIPGISLELAEANGIVLSVPDAEQPSISADQAVAKADGKVEQAVLAHLTDKTVQPGMDRLVWVLVMSDDSYGLSADADYLPLYLNFVDANSGEWLFGYGEEATCSQTPEAMAECEKRGITPKIPAEPRTR